MNKQQALDYLIKNNIQFQLYEHQAVFTCEEAEVHCKHVPGLAVKNLLLKSDKQGTGLPFPFDGKNPIKRQFFLVVLPAHKKLDMNQIKKVLEVKKLRFASAEDLMRLMKLEPGSVTPIGLINDKNKEIELILDNNVKDADMVNFHPNVNTASVSLSKKEFEKFLNSLDRKARIILA